GFHVSPELLLGLLVWGTFVGLDLVSVPQMMIARPLVAGPIAGAMLGDVWTGLSLGVLFELFQYEVMPVGAVRYPEYGPATVVAVSAAHAAAGTHGHQDRKSTRLNSSHVKISYAVFCLKKKKNKKYE